MFENKILYSNNTTPTANRIAISVFFFISGFNFAAWSSQIPRIQKQLQLNDAELGSVLTALPTGLMITMPLAGIVLSKVRSRNVMLYSSLVYTVLLCLLGMVESVWQIVVILFLFGASRNFFNISVNTQSVAAQALYKKSILTSFHGIWSLAALFGAGVSFIFISLHFSILLHFCIMAFISLILIAIFYRNTLDDTDIKNNTSFAFRLPDKSLLQLGCIGFIVMVCEGTMSDWSSIYFSKVVQLPDTKITIGYIAYLSAMVLGRFLGDWLVTTFGEKKIIQLSSILIAFGFVLSVIFPFVITASIGFIAVGFGVSCIMPLIYSITRKISNLPTGVAIASIGTISYLGFLIGPTIVGYIAQLFNLQWSFVLVALVAFCIYLIIFRLPIKLVKQ
ncbi:MAG: MFS transporter [Chitinophagaceae bacterium]